jgi:hypothetical protein
MSNANLERIARGTSRVMSKMDDFYDTRSSRWYLEAAKHLVPSYTVNRMSDTGSEIITMIGFGIDVAKTLGYAYLFSRI